MTKAALEALISELWAVCQELLVAADRPHGTHKDPDAILRAEQLLRRLKSSWDNVDRPATIDTTEIPRLIGQGWEVFYEVTADEDGWTSPPAWAGLKAKITVSKNRAQKRVLIRRTQRT
jgi:hypothetical protein